MGGSTNQKMVMIECVEVAVDVMLPPMVFKARM